MSYSELAPTTMHLHYNKYNNPSMHIRNHFTSFSQFKANATQLQVCTLEAYTTPIGFACSQRIPFGLHSSSNLQRIHRLPSLQRAGLRLDKSRSCIRII